MTRFFVRLRLHPWDAILNVGGEEHLSSIIHEVRRVPSRTVWGWSSCSKGRQSAPRAIVGQVVWGG
jgi:hypothetical protein